MADIPTGNNPDDGSPDVEIIEGMTGVEEARRLERLRLAIEVVRQQARTLNAEVTQEMDRLGLPLPADKGES